MLQLTNKDLETMIKIEELLHKKLQDTKATKKEWNLWTKYWNLVELLCQQKYLLNKMKNKGGKNSAR